MLEEVDEKYRVVEDLKALSCLKEEVAGLWMKEEEEEKRGAAATKAEEADRAQPRVDATVRGMDSSGAAMVTATGARDGVWLAALAQTWCQ